jgi:hypothetical protein
MKVFLFKYRLNAHFSTSLFGLFAGFSLLCVLLFLFSCGPTRLHPLMSAGEPKYSLPFFDKDLAEEVHSIAVPPFLGDQHNWHETAFEILSSSKGISVTPSGKMNDALKHRKGELSSLQPEKRLAFIAELGRTLQTDAVMNGVILNKQGQIEIILQVVSSRDSRMIWWQAVEVSFREGTLSRSGRQRVLFSLLSTFLSLAGKKEPPPQPQLKQEPGPPSGSYPQTEGPSRTKTPSAMKPARKLSKKPHKNQKPLQLPDDISPM